MKKIGLIGHGYWGKILLPKLQDLGDVKFICTSKDDYVSHLNSVEWVFVATPNDTHYAIVKKCILKGKNVFCEKPLTLNYQQSLELFLLANEHGAKLYVDDIFNYRPEYKLLRETLDASSPVEVYWSSPTTNYLYDNLYHDLYLLHHILSSPTSPAISVSPLLQINNIEFHYINSPIKLHRINDIDLTHRPESNDALTQMVNKVLNLEPNYLYNSHISLQSNYLINLIEKLL